MESRYFEAKEIKIRSLDIYLSGYSLTLKPKMYICIIILLFIIYKPKQLKTWQTKKQPQKKKHQQKKVLK